MAQQFDVVVVGGGSAGAVLATRLSEDAQRSVLLIEGGPVYPVDSLPDVISDAARVGGDAEHDWGYTAKGTSEQQPFPVPRGKVLGGSSSVNATVALRARKNDFDFWAARGVSGWDFDDVLETYKAIENAPTGDDAFHGRTGPFPIRQRSYEELTPALQAFIDASVQQGITPLDDMNGPEQDGVGPNPLNTIDEVRQSTAITYLTEEVRARRNLEIRGATELDRVLFEDGRAVGVLTTSGERIDAGEVVLSAGTYGSAAILLRSGVGPREDLEALGIDVVADLPVGRFVQDHPFFFNVWALKPEFGAMRPAAGALVWTASSEARGDELDLHISATHLVDPGYSPTGAAVVLAIAVVQPESTGTISLQSTDPTVAPVIDLNLLATPRDRSRMLEGLKLSRRIAAEPKFAAILESEVLPGVAIQTDEQLNQSIEAIVNTYAHPTSSVPMGGEDDERAVVDGDGAVRGVSGLRVIDASIMPRVPSAPTNLTTIMLAERIAARVWIGQRAALAGATA